MVFPEFLLTDPKMLVLQDLSRSKGHTRGTLELAGVGGAASAHGDGGGVVNCALEGDEPVDEEGEDGEGEDVSDEGVCGCGEGV